MNTSLGPAVKYGFVFGLPYVKLYNYAERIS
jgi:hypothetical protein